MVTRGFARDFILEIRHTMGISLTLSNKPITTKKPSISAVGISSLDISGAAVFKFITISHIFVTKRRSRSPFMPYSARPQEPLACVRTLIKQNKGKSRYSTRSMVFIKIGHRQDSNLGYLYSDSQSNVLDRSTPTSSEDVTSSANTRRERRMIGVGGRAVERDIPSDILVIRCKSESEREERSERERVLAVTRLSPELPGESATEDLLDADRAVFALVRSEDYFNENSFSLFLPNGNFCAPLPPKRRNGMQQVGVL
ncbi:hypothetical protein J6590_047116 [Homalodisca vitripennis]|nr:hypothetical protein J6590_047116 [Homalodisca vitripennis]